MKGEIHMLKKYTWNVFEIAKANGEDLGVALRMLINNIQQGKAVNPGADLDYAAIKAAWDKLSTKEQEAEIEAMHDLFDFGTDEPYHSLAEAFQDGDRAAFDKAMEG